MTFSYVLINNSNIIIIFEFNEKTIFISSISLIDHVFITTQTMTFLFDSNKILD